MYFEEGKWSIPYNDGSGTDISEELKSMGFEMNGNRHDGITRPVIPPEGWTVRNEPKPEAEVITEWHPYSPFGEDSFRKFVLDDEDRPRLYLFVYYGDIDELRDYDYGYAKILET